MSSLRDLERIHHDAVAAIEAARTAHDLDEVKRRYLGRKGILAQLFADVEKGAEEKSREGGERSHVLPKKSTEKKKKKEAALRQELQTARTQAEALDVTLPGRRTQLGRRHVLTRTLEAMERIFFGMGFEVVEGTEVETDEFNFERLNMGRDHPARDAQDSFYLSDDFLLRTHTTVVDARVMVGRKPPMRILNSGRCYRRDAPDATHMPVFHQVDGFMVGERITFADLRGVLASFVRQMFGPQAVYRFVPSYFPFTEPSAELLVWFGNRWLELAGSGMFHPRVLEMAGIDPTRYTAFAFGLGVDRPAMVRYGIPDIRYFWENDLRLLEQF